MHETKSHDSLNSKSVQSEILRETCHLTFDLFESTTPTKTGTWMSNDCGMVASGRFLCLQAVRTQNILCVRDWKPTEHALNFF